MYTAISILIVASLSAGKLVI